MSRWIRRSLVAVVISAFAITAANVNATEDKAWDIETVMKKLMNKKGAIEKSKAAVKEGKWEDAAKLAKDIKKGGEDLGKNAVPKGEKESWEKLTKSFAENTKAMSDAVEKKDKEAFEKAAKAVGGSCKSCHDSHK
jgi:cytochrome c556